MAHIEDLTAAHDPHGRRAPAPERRHRYDRGKSFGEEHRGYEGRVREASQHNRAIIAQGPDGGSHEDAPDHKGQVHGGQHRGVLHRAPGRSVLEIRDQELLLSARAHKDKEEGSGKHDQIFREPFLQVSVRQVGCLSSNTLPLSGTPGVTRTRGTGIRNPFKRGLLRSFETRESNLNPYSP